MNENGKSKSSGARFYASAFVALMLLVVSAVAFTSCGSDTKVYKIVTDSVYAPFEFENSSGVYEGIDIEILAEVAKAEGFEYEVTHPGFDAAIQAVIAGSADGVIAGMSITAERQKVYDFSTPYYLSGLALTVKPDSTIESYSDLSGKTVGAKTSTASATWLEEHKGDYGYEVKEYEDATPMYGALEVDAIDALMDDSPVVGYAISQGKQLKTPIATPEKAGSYGFAVKTGKNAELLEKFNSGLLKIIANGTYDKILEKYGASSGNVVQKGGSSK
jgi:polar amino acid transport system substrate-binding protein